jgi:diguanylate cyclase (GGDEF)-like protein
MKHKLTVALVGITGAIVAAAYAALPHFDHPSLFSALLEGSLVLIAFTILYSLERLAVKARFYRYLTVGFLLLYVSLLVDWLDEFFFQPDWLSSVEELTLLSGFLLTTYGIYLATHYHYQQVQKLEKLAETDSLTGLLNRRAIIQQLDNQTMLCRQDPSQIYSIIIADVDCFKDVNDQHGHDTGDNVLRHIAHTLAGSLRASDRIARWGGEEFIILLPQTQEGGAALVAEKIRQVITDSPYCLNGQPVRLSVSLGVAQASPEDCDWNAVIKQADAAMYLAKRSGRNRVRTASQIKQALPGSLLSAPA